MADLIALFSKLRANGISLSLDDKESNLVVRGKLSVLGPEDKEQIRNAKEELIAFLKQQRLSRLSIPEADENEIRFPLAPAQTGIWVHERLNEGQSPYTIPAVFTLQLPGFDKHAFSSAISFLASQNKILRAVFSEEDGVPYQQIDPQIDPDKHLFFHPLAINGDWVNEQVSRRIAEPLSISGKPLWEIDVYEQDGFSFTVLLRVHHLIADGETLNFVIREVLSLYQQFVSGEVPAKKYFQYPSYINWIRNRENFQASQQFWKTNLAGTGDELTLYPDLRAGTRSFEGNEIVSVFPASLVSRLQEFKHKNRITFSSLFTAAAGLVLGKRGRSSDFIIGIPAASRTVPQLQQAIGNYVNILPFRIQIDYNQTTTGFVKQIQQNYHAVLEHQLYPFEYILEDIGYTYGPGDFPLFSVMVSVPNNLELQKSDEEISLKKAQSLYDITFTFLEFQNEIRLVTEYNTARFFASTIQQIAAEVQIVLEQLTAAEAAGMETVSLRKSQHLFIPNAPEITNNHTPGLISLLEKAVSLNPDHVALQNQHEQISYSEFRNRAAAYAAYFISCGVKPGDRIIIALPRSAEQTLLMWACWYAGAVYVPVDTRIPENRFQSVITDCSPVLVVNSDFVKKIPAQLSFASGLPALSAEPDSLAYIIYTSGSTGVPKGVMISHENLVAKMQDESKVIGYVQPLVTATLTNPAFDVSLLETVLPLLCGGKISIVSEEELEDAEKTTDLLIRRQVTVIQGTPTYFSHLLSVPASFELLNKTLRLICIGGESLSNALAHKIKQLLPDVQLNNHYGPTEITIDAIIHESVGEFDKNSIGKPFGSVFAFVIDDQHNLLPENCIGELVVGGPSVSPGYWNRPDLTAEKFLVLPFSGTRPVYKTGDLVRQDEHGNFEFVGRKDSQTKWRGYRIETEDITSTLLRLPGVKEAFTTVRDGQLISWITGTAKPGTALTEALRAELPPYMIPLAVVAVAEIPRTANGKADLKKLPAPASAEMPFTGPRNETEEILSQIWMDVLEKERISIHDDFFVLGGHSLRAIRLLGRYRRHFSAALSFADIFGSTTIAEHAALLQQKLIKPAVKILPVSQQDDYPVSDAQRRLWILSQLEQVSGAYNMPVIYELPADQPAGRLSDAIRQLIERHEMLRTVFIPGSQDEVRQRILPSADFPDCVPVVDCTAEKRSAAEIRKEIESDFYKPFNLETGPLIRGGIYITGDQHNFLYFNLHHIICDGWSINLLYRELLSLWQSSVALPALPFQYKDYASWQNRQIQENAFENQKAFWLLSFENEAPSVELPVQKKRPLMRSFSGFTLGTGLSVSLTERLRAVCSKQQATVFMGLLAGLNAFLMRYTGQHDFVIGTPVANRDHEGLEDQIGLYVNTLALRNAVNPEMNFAALLSQVKENTVAALANKEYPFDRLVDELGLSRDISRHPLFDIMLVLQDDSAQPGLNAVPEEGTITYFGSGISKFDLLFTFQETEGKLFCIAEFNEDIFEKDFAEKMLGHFIGMLDAATADTSVPISSLNYFSESEYRQLVSGFNSGYSDYPRDETIVSLFRKTARKNPDAVAVSDGGQQLTYSQLDQLSDQLAMCLITREKIEHGQIVGVQIERSAAMITALLAVLKTGAVYMPVDRSYPEERIAYLYEDSSCRLIITQEKYDQYISLLPETNDPVSVNLQPSDLVYLIYTSGSTGKPKGIMMEHGSMVNLLDFQMKEFEGRQVKKVLQFANIGFDVSFQETCFALLSGAEIFPVTEQMRTDIPRLLDFIVSREIDTLFFPTAFFKVLAEEDAHIDRLNTCVRNIIVAGEQLVLGRNYLSHTSSTKFALHNHYGPAETHVVTTFTIEADEQYSNPIPPIGKPVSNNRIYLFDENMQLVPKGLAGEIYVGGTGVARGYLNKPELTAERFSSDPFFPEQRLYKTGDLGKLLPDGNFEYIGRKDLQVKIRGYRIEPGEIEAALMGIPGVEGAVVLAHTGRTGEKELAAYIVSETIADTSLLKSSLRASLPDYMVPACFIFLESIPLTSNGKVDQRKLPAPSLENDTASSVYIAPRNPEEELLSVIWCSILGRNAVSAEDNFFDLGGHSLKAIRLVNAVNKETDAQLSLKDIFLFPVLAAQAQLLQNKTRAADVLEKAEEQNGYDLSPSQKRLWIISQLAGGSAAYNIYGERKMIRPFRREWLMKSVNAVVLRHEILRTVFRSGISGEVRQLVLPEVDLNSVVRVIQSTDPEATLLMDQIVNRIFDLENGPLFEIVAVLQPDNTVSIWYNFHHIIFDGWSFDILSAELFQAYQICEGGNEPHFEKIPYQYSDYAGWINRQLKSDAFETHRAFWLSKLNGKIPVIDLPSHQPRPVLKTFNGHILRTAISPQAYRRISALCRENEASLFMGMTTAVLALLHRYTDQDDLVIGFPVSGRSRKEFEQLIGFFVNTISLRTQFKPEETYRSLLRQTKENMIECFNWQDYPFDAVVKDLAVERDNSRNPLFDIIVSLTETEPSGTFPTGNTIQDIGSCYAKFDAEFAFEHNEDGLALNITFNKDVYTESVIRRLLIHFRQLLESVTALPDQRIGLCTMLDDSETKQVVELFNQTQVAFPADKTISDLFEEQALLCPDKIAIVCDGDSCTYKELSRKSNQFAHFLLNEYKVSRNELICIHNRKNIPLIVAMLGIMKAGAAHLPIDPAYPEDRKKYFREVSSSRFVVDEKMLAEFESKLSKYPETHPATERHSEDLFHIMFTSGSTGNPKGVMLSHRNIASLVKPSSYLPLNESTILLSTVAISFDTTNMEFWGTLVNGGRLILLDKEEILNFEHLRSVMRQNEVNTMWLTSALFNQVAEYDPEILSPLRYFLSGGDVVSYRHVNLLLEKNPSLTVINGYGPTENTTFTTTHTVREKLNRSVPIGKPRDNNFVYILNRHGLPQPVDVYGELYIAGEGLSSGYYKNEDQTRQKFIPNPFAHGGMMYRTGDTGRWNSDGTIDFLGRIDNQVKISGHRIDLVEIENVINSIEGIDSSVMIAKEIQGGDKFLVCYYISSAGIEPREIRYVLNAQLPFYAIARHFVRTDVFPLSPNGKVDRRELARLDIRSAEEQAGIDEEFTETELEILRAWSQVLPAGSVSKRQNFFQSGGNSLDSIRIMNTLNSRLGIKLGIADMFNFPTIEELAMCIEEKRKEAERADQIHFSGLTEGPMSFQQERRWDSFVSNPQSTHGNSASRFIIHGNPDADRMNKVLQSIVQKHQIFRTNFDERNGSRIQFVSPHQFQLAFEDLSGLEKTERDARIAAEVKKLTDTPFDLRKDMLFKVKLLRCAPSEYFLVFGIHHIIDDAWSGDMLLREFTELYNQPEKINEGAGLQQLQYIDYAIWQKKHLEKQALQHGLNYFREKLEGRQTPEPFRAKPGKVPVVSRLIETEFSVAETSGLREIILQTEATMQAGMLSIVNTVLSEISGKPVAYLFPVANRFPIETEKMYGGFNNQLIISLPVAQEGITIQDHIREVNAEFRKAFGYSEVPVALIEKTVQANGLWDLAFRYAQKTDKDLASARLDGLDIYPVAIDESNSKSNDYIQLFFQENDDDSLGMKLFFREGQFEIGFLNGLLAKIRDRINSIIQNKK